MSNSDTIAAIATPVGSAGVGIIRLSGGLVNDIVTKIFRPRAKVLPLASHRLYLGEIVSPSIGKVIDEVLVSIMRAPHSYTGEDVLEINCHGSPIVLEMVLSAVIHAGARVALPGEFTRRALVNERIDVAQAEAIFDLINANSPLAASLSIKQLQGGLSKKTTLLRETIAEILSIIEASIDFGEDDAIAVDWDAAANVLRTTINDIILLAKTYKEGKVIANGVTCIIVGRSNVGKSSLLNTLLGEKRAIVTAIAGTTRDFIEEAVIFNGLTIRFIDTAGIRETTDPVEKEGITILWEKFQAADFAICLLDRSAKLEREDREIISRLASKDFIIALNKVDLTAAISTQEIEEIAPNRKIINISAKYGDGIEDLKRLIYQRALGEGDDHGADIIVSRARHKAALDAAAFFLSQALAGIGANMAEELVAQDIRDALSSLASITDAADSAEILDRIFAKFCVGK